MIHVPRKDSGRAFLAAACLAVAFGVGSGLSTLHAQAIKSDSKVKATAKAGKPDAAGKQTLAVTLKIDKGWYIYANPVGNDDFSPNRTVVTVKAERKIEGVKVDYPKGKVKKGGALIGDYNIYQGEVTIPVRLQWAGEPGPLEVTVRLNACDEKGRCLLPGTVKLKVD